MVLLKQALDRPATFPSQLLILAGEVLPMLHQATLSPGKRAFDQLDRVDAMHSYVVLIIRVKVRQVVGLADLPNHSNNNAEEAAQFGYAGILLSSQVRYKGFHVSANWRSVS